MADEIEQTLVQPGGANESWIVVLGAWAVLTGVVYVTTDFGLPGTVAGTAGLYFVYRGIRAIWKAVASRSVEHEAIGSLGGKEGSVVINGTVQPAEEPITTPMTKTETAAYRVKVTQYEPTSQE